MFDFILFVFIFFFLFRFLCFFGCSFLLVFFSVVGRCGVFGFIV